IRCCRGVRPVPLIGTTRRHRVTRAMRGCGRRRLAPMSTGADRVPLGGTTTSTMNAAPRAAAAPHRAGRGFCSRREQSRRGRGRSRSRRARARARDEPAAGGNTDDEGRVPLGGTQRSSSRKISSYHQRSSSHKGSRSESSRSRQR
ncbi:unnamed protein product, partial [Ectocarpus sp. 13 AM-2016]